MKYQETQQSVSEWAREMFGERTLNYRALMVLEEALELCAACGVSNTTVKTYVIQVQDKIAAQKMKSPPSEEAADVLSTLYALATVGGFDVHDELDYKMGFNRSRSAEYYAAKTRGKGL